MLFRADSDHKLKLKHLYQVSPETRSWERLTPHSSDRVRVLKPFHPYKQLESKSLPTATVFILQLKKTNKQAKNVHEDEKSKVKHGDVLPGVSTEDTTITGSIGLHYSFQ